jgi:hypothetical protein
MEEPLRGAVLEQPAVVGMSGEGPLAVPVGNHAEGETTADQGFEVTEHHARLTPVGRSGVVDAEMESPRHRAVIRSRPRRYNGLEEYPMTRTVVVKGRLVGPHAVGLDEPLPAQASGIEVRARVETAGSRGAVTDFLRSLPPGTRTKEEIDRQINEERNSWDR